MRFDLETWQRWCNWIVQIRDDLSDMAVSYTHLTLPTILLV